MLLRTRLTLLYTMLMGGVFLLSGFAVYAIVSVLMINHIDRDLTDTARIMISNLVVKPGNEFELNTLTTELPLETFSFQVWDANGRLQISDPTNLNQALNEKGLVAKTVILQTTTTSVSHLRVLSEPVYSERGLVGIFQIAASLSSLDDIQTMLTIVLIIISLAGIVLTGLISWRVTDTVLRPLESVVQIASQITRVDDLSRRIPRKTDRKDEVGILIDVINQTLERLELLFSSQQRFLADISHDLRTPLTVIKGNVDLIRRMGRVDEESLASIEAEVNRLTRMVGDLLLLAQAESGQLPLRWEPVRLDTLVQEVFKAMKTIAGEKITLNIKDIVDAQVMGDADKLKQVFINLVSNAIKYTPNGGSVTIDMAKTSKHVKVSVSDTGPGIEARHIPYIFERFFRTEPSRPRSKDSGFGLGLAIAKWVVKQHHGEILVKSQVGVGTTFTVRLNLIDKEK